MNAENFSFSYWNKIVLHFIRSNQPDHYAFLAQSQTYKERVATLVSNTQEIFNQSFKENKPFDVCFADAVTYVSSELSYNLYLTIYNLVVKVKSSLSLPERENAAIVSCCKIREDFSFEEINPKLIAKLINEQKINNYIS